MAGTDDMLQNLLSSFMAQNEEYKNQYVAIQNQSLERQQLQEDLVNQQTASGVNVGGQMETPLTIQVKEQAQLKAQQDARDVATAMGTNPDESSYILKQLATNFRSSAIDAFNTHTAVEDKLNTKFMDNPAQWLINQFTMGHAMDEANNATERFNIASDTLSKAQMQTQNLQTTMNSIAQAKTAETVQAKTDAITAEVNANADKVKINNINTNLAAMKEIGDMTQVQFNNVYKISEAFNSAEQLKISQEHAAQSKRMADLQYEDRSDKLEQRKLNEAEMNDLANDFRKGFKAMGYDNYTTLPTMKLFNMQKVDPELFKRAYRAANLSQQFGAQVIDENPGEVAKLVGDTGIPLSKDQKDIKRLFQESWQDARDPNSSGARQARTSGYDANKPDQVVALSGRLALDKAKSDLADINPKNASNIYAAPALPAVLDFAPQIKKTELYTKVLSGQMTTGQLKEFNPEQLVSFASAAVKDKTIDFNTASKDLQTIFNSAMMANNVTKNYAGVGLPLQDSYRTKLTDLFGNLKSYNLVNAVDVSRALAVEGLRGTPLYNSRATVDNPFELN